MGQSFLFSVSDCIIENGEWKMGVTVCRNAMHVKPFANAQNIIPLR